MSEIRTAVYPVTLNGADYRRTHDACHTVALLWNRAVDWVHVEWKAGHSPRKYEIQSFLTSIPLGMRPLHAHTTEIIAHDLYEAITTSRTNRKNAIKVRSPWRKKNYRPLSFTKGYGWRISNSQLHLSLGRGRPRIDLPVPVLLDGSLQEPVSPEMWREIQLCWDQDARQFSLRIPYQTIRTGSVGDAVTAIDEGIINPMTLATWVDDKTVDVTIINGREARAVKRQRNKSVGQLQHKISRCKNGSRKHARLVTAKKKAKTRAKAQFRDFNHQVSRKAADHVIAHGTGRLVVGDVRGIEKKTKQQRRMGRHGRQQLSQWERGVQERYLSEKTKLKLDHQDESYSSRTCPACGARNRPSGRDYRCKACGFACHRDAVGAINILQKALYGEYTPIRGDTDIRVTYLRAVERWSPGQRKAHHKVQRRKARALSIAQNRASTGTTRQSKPKQTTSFTSTDSSVLDRLVAVT
ncbi:MAG: RNA-guided endonuclease InsQ/TnpB family protein [Acidimicrobiales bacterium]